MLVVVILIILFGIFNTASVVFTGNRGLISGDIFGKDFFNLILNWRFILAMILAIGSRFTFIYINNLLLKIPHLANSSTTITSFATALSFIFIIIANYFYLDERLTLQQFIGAIFIMGGIVLMVK
jgi:drug/metabolite transporter (DMT)-like permease